MTPQFSCESQGFLNLEKTVPGLLAEEITSVATFLQFPTSFLWFFSCFFVFFFFPNAQDIQIIPTFHTWNFCFPLSGFQIKPNRGAKITFDVVIPQTRTSPWSHGASCPRFLQDGRPSPKVTGSRAFIRTDRRDAAAWPTRAAAGRPGASFLHASSVVACPASPASLCWERHGASAFFPP